MSTAPMPNDRHDTIDSVCQFIYPFILEKASFSKTDDDVSCNLRDGQEIRQYLLSVFSSPDFILLNKNREASVGKCITLTSGCPTDTSPTCPVGSISAFTFVIEHAEPDFVRLPFGVVFEYVPFHICFVDFSRYSQDT